MGITTPPGVASTSASVKELGGADLPPPVPFVGSFPAPPEDAEMPKPLEPGGPPKWASLMFFRFALMGRGCDWIGSSVVAKLTILFCFFLLFFVVKSQLCLRELEVDK